jgi:hypothetical protein
LVLQSLLDPFFQSVAAKSNDKFRSAPFSRLHPRNASVALSDLPHNRKARSRAFDLPPDGSLK